MNSKIKLQNKNGISAELIEYGARLTALWVPDSNGKMDDIVMGFNTPQEYLFADETYFGATVGRYANRISNGRFTINETEHKIAVNHPPNHLHGGKSGWHKKNWKVEKRAKNTVLFSLLSEDGDEGFPGNVHANVQYTLDDENILKIRFTATCDKNTPLNMCHHSYFNLGGHDSGSVLDHQLVIKAEYFTPVDKSLIPTGELRHVKDSPFDFRTMKSIGKHITSEDLQIQRGNGYDHNYVLKKVNSPIISKVATVKELQSGRVMEIHTNQPGMQFYTANWLSGKDLGKTNKAYKKHSAFCLETQHFPDSPNQPQFPSCILQTGETYDFSCWFKFRNE